MENFKRLFHKISLMPLKEIEKEYTTLGEGAGRKVFELDKNVVFKVAKNRLGYFQNRVEHFIFRHSDKRAKDILCPIVWFRPRIVVMQRAQLIPSEDGYIDLESHLTSEQLDKLEYLFRSFRLLPRDTHYANSWGKVNNQMVLIDYGWPTQKGVSYYKMKFSMQNILGPKRF